ncbi:MAG: EamA family transporter, partial [Gemmatimonadota bacterium]
GWAFRPGAAGALPDGGESGGREEGEADAGAADAPPRRAVLVGLGVQGLLFAVMFVTQMEALRLSLAANVITVKRSGTLLTVLLGGMLFREKGLAHRLAGTVVVLAGVYLVARS